MTKHLITFAWLTLKKSSFIMNLKHGQISSIQTDFSPAPKVFINIVA